MTTQTDSLPRWDLSNVYPSLDSQEFKSGMEDLKSQVEALGEFLDTNQIAKSTAAQSEKEAGKLAAVVGELLERSNEAFLLSATLRAYIFSIVSTDSYNTVAKRAMSQWEMLSTQLQQHATRMQGWIGTLGNQLLDILKNNDTAERHACFLQEAAEQAKYLMSDAEENLAAELGTSGTNAWSRLQGTVTSQLKVEFDVDGEMQTIPITTLLNYRNHPEEEARRRAYETEMEAWERVREPLAAALNGVKGASGTLQRRRGREDAVHGSIDDARIDRPTLEAMLEAMKDSFPTFRGYFKAKAKRFGSEALPWWNIFAPTGKTDRTYSYEEATAFVVEHFGAISPELANFAANAFEKNWIDVGPRDGKRAGAFCMGVPAVEESRVLLNFDGSLDSVSTLAHELGHGFHNYCLKGTTLLNRQTPMTLAETASIMCQTIITEATIAQAASPEEELAILENSLIDASQVVVDIYSRYLFETEVFERRAKAELSADEFCEIMEEAQAQTYGEGLDERYRHKYMWTWKPHYYFAGLDFYNYPYTFGLLFGTGLYAIYQQRGADFVPDYKNLLASTGKANAADLAARFEIDIRAPKFWEDSLGVIGKQIERYKGL